MMNTMEMNTVDTNTTNSIRIVKNTGSVCGCEQENPNKARVFINLSNHNSADWGANQMEAARVYGRVIDIDFPQVDPYWTDAVFNRVVDTYYEKIMAYADPVVMLQGEFVFTYRLADRLIGAGIKVVAVCSERRAVEYIDENGKYVKKSGFVFVQFREYPNPA